MTLGGRDATNLDRGPSYTRLPNQKMANISSSTNSAFGLGEEVK